MMLHILLHQSIFLLHLPFHPQLCGSMLVCWASSSSGNLHQIKVLYRVLTQAPHTPVSTEQICSLCRLRQQSGYEIASSELHCILSGIYILATQQYYHSIPLCFLRAFHTDEHRISILKGKFSWAPWDIYLSCCSFAILSRSWQI